MIHRRKRRISDRRKILNSASVKVRKALRCYPSHIDYIILMKHKIEELVTNNIERFEFLNNPSKVPNIKRIAELFNQGYNHNQIAETLRNEGAVSGKLKIISAIH